MNKNITYQTDFSKYFTANKIKVVTIALVLMLTFTVTLVALPMVSAHEPAWEIPTYSYVYVAPAPIGVGQTAHVVFWLDKIPPTAAGAGGDRWRDMTIEVTAPDGSIANLGPFTSDPVGGGYTTYTPDQIGTYTFVFNFPGQTASLEGPTGVPGSQSANIGDYYLPSSAETTITVQQDLIPSPPSYQLPNEYWSRPIEGQNTDWYKIASNWLGGSHIVGSVQQDGIAPNSPHIMWTKPLQDGGVVGGSRIGQDGMTYYDGTAYEGRFNSLIIMNGRLYYNLPVSGSGSGGGYVCVDLRTGEELWWKDTSMPSFAQLYDYESPNQHGVIPNGYLWATVGGSRWGPPTPQNWSAYDSITGDWLFSLTNVPVGTDIYGPNGELLRYVLDTTGKWLAVWNNTAAHGLTAAMDPTDTTSSSYLQWRPVGKTVDASNAYSWNVSIPWLPAGASVLKVIHDDFLLGMNGSFPSLTSSEPYTLWALSLKSESRGDLLWMETYNAPEGNITRELAPMWMSAYIDPETGVFLQYDKETIQWSGYSLEDGSLLWGPTASEHGLNYYADVGLIRYAVAYGKLYSAGYSGIVYCYDLTTGDLLWEYNSPAGLASHYPNWPLGIGAIADGKVYLYTTEHSANQPKFKGVQIHCINATTGEEIWTVDGYGTQGGMAIADGYMIYLNLYDMQIYCVGKGPSATTVMGPETTIPIGDELLIRGTVTDKSAGTNQHEQAARFPNGVPVMSDESMTDWMEYVYMQKPYPEDATGVEVVITTIDPNGNSYELGRTVTDTNGAFGCVVDPPVPGKYKIVATFEGSESYYTSSAVTYINVGESPSAAQPIEPEQGEPTVQELTTSTPRGSALVTPTELTVLAIVAVACIICAVAFLALRKRK